MKKVTEKVWKEKAAGLAEWRKNRASPPSLDIYAKIVDLVHVGSDVLDVGAGQRYLSSIIPLKTKYTAIDPFPLDKSVHTLSAESLVKVVDRYDTVFMLAALDNVRDVELALKGLKNVAKENIVILTGIGIEPDKNHTVQIDRKDLTDVLGEPTLEVEMLKNVFLFEWRLC